MLKKITVFTLLVLLLIPSFAYGDAIINAEVNKAIMEYKDEIKVIANILIGFSAVTSVLIFIIHFLRLGGLHSRPHKRKEVIKDLMVSGMCTAAIGGFGLLFRIYLSIFVA
jgi:hypothetical protein